MSIATQIERLQGVRDQIRTKMVSLGLSENTDLLQNLADDLDGVSKITPTSSTTDPGTSYTNTTLDRSTSTRYVKIPKGYNSANIKFTVSGVPNGVYSASVSSHTTSNASASSSVSGSITNISSTTKPGSGTDGTNYYTITPSLSTSAGSSKAVGKATVSTAGYISAGNTTSSESSKTVSVSASQGSSYYLPAGAYSASISSHTTSNASASSSVTGTITGIATTTAPTSGTDGTNYYTITPKLTTGAGKSKVKAKATVSTAGYIATGSKETSEASKDVGVSGTQGGNYYLPAATYTDKGTTDPGTGYTNKLTISPSGTASKYIQITKGYTPNSKITINKMSAGTYSASVSSHTVKTKPTASSSISGSITDIASTVKPTGAYYMITPSLSTTTGSVEAEGKATIGTAGYIATGSKTEGSTIDVSVSASQGKDYYLRTGEYSISVSSHTTTNATASSSVSGTITGITTTTAPASGTDGTDYYTITPKLATGMGKSKVKVKATVDTAGYIATGSKETSEASKDVSVSATQGSSYYLPASTFGSETTTNPTSSTNLKSVTPGTAAKYIPINAGYRSAGKITVNAISTETKTITAGTSASTTSATSGKFITSVTVNPTPSQSKVVTPTMAGQTVSPDAGKLLSSVTVNAVPSFTVTLPSSMWGNSGSDVAAGKYYYNVSNEHITASNNLYVMPNNASAAQSFGVYAYSQSRTSGAKTGALQFRAMERPTSDLTYTVYYLN